MRVWLPSNSPPPPRERREEELRLAYRSARSPEEAAVVLQRYTQRFSISEAVMERLQLPKLLDHGPASPLSPLSPLGPAHDSDGPMRFLRQQSAPAPRFTATVEARVEEVPRGSSPSYCRGYLAHASPSRRKTRRFRIRRKYCFSHNRTLNSYFWKSVFLTWFITDMHT